MTTLSLRRQAAFDVGAILAAIVLAWAICRMWLYPALGIGDNAPVILRPIGGFLVAWWLLKRRDRRWSDLGLRKPSSWPQAVLVAIVAYAVLWLLSPLASSLFAAWLPSTSQPGFLGYIHGNLPATMLWLGIGWMVGGFCEEALFRGFLLNRVAALCGGGTPASVACVLAQALLFGSLHYYAGPVACADAAFFGLVMGVAYLVGGRNLLPLMVVHGVWDTVGIWGVYTG